MTIEQAPSTNGRTSSEQTYPPPATPARPMTIEHQRAPASRRHPGLVRLVMPMLFAIAVALVVRGLTHGGDEPGVGARA